MKKTLSDYDYYIVRIVDNTDGSVSTVSIKRYAYLVLDRAARAAGLASGRQALQAAAREIDADQPLRSAAVRALAASRLGVKLLEVRGA